MSKSTFMSMTLTNVKSLEPSAVYGSFTHMTWFAHRVDGGWKFTRLKICYINSSCQWFWIEMVSQVALYFWGVWHGLVITMQGLFISILKCFFPSKMSSPQCNYYSWTICFYTRTICVMPKFLPRILHLEKNITKKLRNVWFNSV